MSDREELDKLKQRIERLERHLERVSPGALGRTDEFILLDEKWPGWKRTVGELGEDNDFRRWLRKQPQVYRELVERTESASVLMDCLMQFEAAHRVLQ